MKNKIRNEQNKDNMIPVIRLCKVFTFSYIMYYVVESKTD